MGRRNLSEERRAEILDAFERCIRRYGIDVPLERVAEEAGVQRSLIRHYLGNRDDLVDQVIMRIADGYPATIAACLDEAAGRGVAGVLDFLFNSTAASDWDAVIPAVVATAEERYPRAKQRVSTMMVRIVELLATSLGQLFPDAPRAQCYAVAYAVLAIVQSNDSLLWLGLDPRHSAMARAAATDLIAGLARPGERPVAP